MKTIPVSLYAFLAQAAALGFLWLFPQYWKDFPGHPIALILLAYGCFLLIPIDVFQKRLHPAWLFLVIIAALVAEFQLNGSTVRHWSGILGQFMSMVGLR